MEELKKERKETVLEDREEGRFSKKMKRLEEEIQKRVKFKVQVSVKQGTGEKE